MISKIIQKKIFDIVFNIQEKYNISNKKMYIILSIWHHFQQLTCCLIILFNSNLLIMIFNLCALLEFLINFVFHNLINHYPNLRLDLIYYQLFYML